jgi:hypothetical protein
MATDGNLTTKQRAAIAALLTEGDILAAAKKANVGERTLHRWLKDDPDFQRELKAAESAAIEAAIRRLADSTGLAVETLRQAMESTDAPLPQKIRAADIVLSRLLELRNLHTLEERLTVVEAALSKIGGEK